MGNLKKAGQPTPGTIMGAIGCAAGIVALIISLSGIATAQPSRPLIHRGDIAPGAVTAKTIARGAVRAPAIARAAVTSSKLSRGSVTAAALAKRAVNTDALADDAVTSRVLAPGSVYGGALGKITPHTATIKDEDAAEGNAVWTTSSGVTAKCAPGERLWESGFNFLKAGNREVAFTQVVPFSEASGDGVLGQITSNSGGSAEGQVVALFLE